MCGIVGFSRPGLGERDYSTAVTAMTASLAHRGPDDNGQWQDADAAIAIGHRRLSIIDTSPLGHQPMTSASGRYVIVYNGEVYNFPSLRAELTSAGASFNGASDTEVMLATIEAWGLAAAVRRFTGMFAFALWDRQLRTLSLVRDRLGIKPLYWGQIGELFLFGSELKALLACPGWTPEIDRDSLAAYMRWNYVPSPHSIYNHVRKLEPGTILTWQQGQAPTITRYWDVREIAREGITANHELSDDEAKEALDALLREVIGDHMVSDVPLGAFLSGGIDSSLVVALMQAQSNRPVKTFSIGFSAERYNEAEHAKAVAGHLGTDHTELYVQGVDALNLVPNLPSYYDEPLADSSQLPTYLVAAMTRRDVTVALSGDGGDELFAGYTRYQWADMVWRRFGRIPLSVRKGLASAIKTVPRPLWGMAEQILPAGFGAGRLGERAVKLAYYMSRPDPDAVYRAQHTHWLAPSDLVINGVEPRGVSWDSDLTNMVPDFIPRMQLMDTLQYLPDDILTKVDRATMAVSLEARVPLLDHRLVEFAWHLPARMKLRGTSAKWLLRQVLYDYVPSNLIDRPKAGFSAPVAAWLRGPLRDWAETLLAPARLAREGYLAPDHVDMAWREFLGGRDELREPLWGALMFQAWYEATNAINRSA
jgi:asparagine synthase (glutamine-hydrolysing)